MQLGEQRFKQKSAIFYAILYARVRLAYDFLQKPKAVDTLDSCISELQQNLTNGTRRMTDSSEQIVADGDKEILQALDEKRNTVFGVLGTSPENYRKA